MSKRSMSTIGVETVDIETVGVSRLKGQRGVDPVGYHTHNTQAFLRPSGTIRIIGLQENCDDFITCERFIFVAHVKVVGLTPTSG